MASLITALGLHSPSSPNLVTPNYAPVFVTFHFVFACVVLAPRHLKEIYGIDRNVSPREDLAKDGNAAVESGKITQNQLEMMRRNTIENYVFFGGAISFAAFTGVERKLENRAALIYTGARVAYALIYILVDRPFWSLFPSVAWWAGNINCLWMLRKAENLSRALSRRKQASNIGTETSSYVPSKKCTNWWLIRYERDRCWGHPL